MSWLITISLIGFILLLGVFAYALGRICDEIIPKQNRKKTYDDHWDIW